MKLSELQEKVVVNIDDGQKIGNIIDVHINKDGQTIGLMVERTRFLLSLFTNNVIEVKWGQIKKIGKDVILVHLD